MLHVQRDCSWLSDVLLAQDDPPPTAGFQPPRRRTAISEELALRWLERVCYHVGRLASHLVDEGERPLTSPHGDTRRHRRRDIEARRAASESADG